MAGKSDRSLNKLEELKSKQEHILQMGGSKAIEERHKKGQMSAWERIDYFFDPGSLDAKRGTSLHQGSGCRQSLGRPSLSPCVCSSTPDSRGYRCHNRT